MTSHEVYTKQGIYHGLPTFPASLKDQTAIVTGANGISGQYMLRVLLNSPSRWKKIYALSRTPPTGIKSSRVEHIAVDLLSGVDKIEEELIKRNVRANYVFFFAYKEVSGKGGELWAGQEQMVQENGKMLTDFLLALKERPFERVVLQTGAKNYGLHLGPVPIPCREDDPRVVGQPNFYYAQEDILFELGPKYGFTHCVVRPCHIIGAVKGNFMNLAIVLGLYFVLQKELGKPATFPGTEAKYLSVDSFSSARLNAQLEEWCALMPGCANEAFNTVNGDVATWQRLFEDLAAFFDVDIENDQFRKAPPRPLHVPVPDVTTNGHAARSNMVLRNSLVQWSKESQTINAWKTLSEREGLDHEVFEVASWAFADGVISLQYNVALDMNKARSYGYFGTCNTSEDFIAVLKTAQELKFLPKYA